MAKHGKKLIRYACVLAPFSVNASSRLDALKQFRAWNNSILAADVYPDGPDIIINHDDIIITDSPHSLALTSETNTFSQQLKLF